MNKFSYDSAQYTGFRPQYPDALFEYLKQFASDGLVLDCGCGSGQGTQGLARYFNRVVATDLSFELLSQAPMIPNVSYLQASADRLPIRSNSINLICVAQAIHWFPLDDFYSEVKHVLKPNGLIAAWGYNQAVIDPAVDDVIKKVYQKISGSQNPSRERKYLYDQYQTLPFPFERIAVPDFKIEMNWNLLQWLGYMNTWPSILEYQKRFNTNLVSEIEDKLISVWGDPLSQKLITWPIYLLMGQFFFL